MKNMFHDKYVVQINLSTHVNYTLQFKINSIKH